MSARPTIPVRIAGTGSILPGRAVSTEVVARAAWPDRDPAQLAAKIGIQSRYWVEDAEDTHATLSARALSLALAQAGLAAGALRRIIHVCCTGGDLLLPATANRIGALLGLPGTCDLFDLNNACAGFLTALDVGARSVATGCGPVGIVVSELWSRHLSPREPRSYAVFGDAVAAVVLTAGEAPDEGLLSSHLRNNGLIGSSVTLAHAGLTGRPEVVQFGVSNHQIAAEATEALLSSARTALAQAGLSLADVRWVLPHQPNGRMLETLVAELGVAPEKLVPVVAEVGSVGAASIPLSLDRLWRSGRVQAGDAVLLLTVGSGISYGGMVYRVGRAP